MGERTVNLVEMEDKIDWCVAALKLLVAQLPSTWEPDTTVREYEKGDADEEEEVAAQLDEVRDVQPETPVCAHRSQTIVKGILRCGQCGFAFGATGIDSAATPVRPV